MNDLRPPVLAEIEFARRRHEFANLTLAERFNLIHRSNLWGAETSVSGLGSEREATRYLSTALELLLTELGVTVLLDIPCGDYRWMADVRFHGRYIGADIVPSIVTANNTYYAVPDRIEFQALDLTSGDLPVADLVFCRDCLVHLSDDNIGRALANIKRSGSRWLLTTTFLDIANNRNIEDGDWRPINLERAPFYLPPPDRIILEGCTEADGRYADKAVGLWRIDDLPAIGQH